MNNIPKVFWYAVSLCILSFTSVISYLAIASNSISLRYADMRIEIANKQAQVYKDSVEIEAIKSELKLMSEQMNQRSKILKAFQTSLSKHSKPDDHSPQGFALKGGPLNFSEILPKTDSTFLQPEKFTDLQERIDKIQPQRSFPVDN